MHFRVPPHEVLRWPSNSLQLITTYASKVPFPEERIEIALAELHATLYNVNKAKTSTAMKASKLLPIFDAWEKQTEAGGEDESRYSPVDLSIMKNLR